MPTSERYGSGFGEVSGRPPPDVPYLPRDHGHADECSVDAARFSSHLHDVGGDDDRHDDSSCCAFAPCIQALAASSGTSAAFERIDVRSRTSHDMDGIQSRRSSVSGRASFRSVVVSRDVDQQLADIRRRIDRRGHLSADSSKVEMPH